MLLWMLPLSGIADGLGTELGFGACVMFFAKWGYEIWKERRTRKAAVEVAPQVANPAPVANPTPRPDNGRRNGGSSTDWILYAIQEQGKRVDKMSEEVTAIREDHEETKVSLGKIQRRLKM